MTSGSHLPIIEPEDSPTSVIPQPEPAAAEENRRLRRHVLEMWDAWSNGREPPSAIPGFPELIPSMGGTTNVPIPLTNPFIPFGYPTMLANFTGTPSEVRPQAPFSGIASTVFTPPPASTMAQPTLPRQSFEPSTFTFQTPQFQLDSARVTSNSYPQHPQCESPIEHEKAVRNPEQEEIAQKMKSIEKSLKNMQGLSGHKSISNADLCMFPHLRGAGGKEELLMAYFGESLAGIASEWYTDQDISHWHIWDDLAQDFVRQFQYNVDIAPDRNTLTNFKKKASKSFREYAIKWREQVARVKPPMDEAEMVNVFLQAQEADYFQNMMSAMGKSFAEAIKIGEMVENSLKTGRIISQSAIRATSQAIQSGSGGLANRKKKEEGAMMASRLRNSHQPRDYFSPSSRIPQHYYPHQDAAYAMAPHPFAVMNNQPYAQQHQHYNQNRAPPPRDNPPSQAPYNPHPPQNNYQYNTRPREPPKKADFTPIGESYSSLFPKLVQMGLLQPVPLNRQNSESPSYRPGTRCAYHSGAEGYDTEDCWTLTRAIENLIE
ncbi:PREDICTED: uncharacterized protein LOC109240926 [Nicotiana attenuata]|uniref:uncharacterized protein LOC109240926 n=1 Tax=Nicotiana attenuata TaxID=49451 RepID=UPI000904CA5D|nr:PREDICTED: uncharacterized protein LOC109240926 [Nicotiana attenuata]